MRRTGDKEQFFVLRAGRLAVTLLGHVKRIGIASGNHQQRLFDQIHSLAGIERHQIHKTALGVTERGVGMRMALQVIFAGSK